MTSSVHQAREVLGHQLRDLRKDAGLSGVRLAALAGWHSSKAVHGQAARAFIAAALKNF